MDTESANLETNPRTITHEIHRRDRFLDSVITHHQTKKGSLTLEIQTNTQSLSPSQFILFLSLSNNTKNTKYI